MVRVAVIGAGAGGLAACKACLEEDIEVVCFERSGRYAGLWNYHEEDIDGEASTMKSTVINTSKEMSAFSDFPPPPEFPNHMHHSMVLKYLTKYAETFGVLRFIRYHHEVVNVIPSADYDETGQWIVIAKNDFTNSKIEEVFDGVMICTGHHVYPSIPDFPGKEKFSGMMVHTHSLRVADAFRDKKVVVIGVGNSGVDAAVEISTVAKQVYLSTRRGTWIFPRLGLYGMPFDAQVEVRAFLTASKIVGSAIRNAIIEYILNLKCDHALYNLKPKHSWDAAHPTINDILPSKISSGAVIIKGNVKKFTEKGVIFEDEQQLTKTDAVVFGTGYEIKFPFLDEKILDTTQNRVELYKFMFPPKLKHHTLCVIGLLQPIGPLFPVMEAQSRWFAALMTRMSKLPSTIDILKDIEEHRQTIAKKFVSSPRHTVQSEYVEFLDDIYSRIGAKPNFLRMAFSDPVLLFHCLLGPAVPYVYRLQGPHSWPGARSAIVETKKRIIYPYRSRCVSVRKSFAYYAMLVLCVPLIVLLFGICIL